MAVCRNNCGGWCPNCFTVAIPAYQVFRTGQDRLRSQMRQMTPFLRSWSAVCGGDHPPPLCDKIVEMAIATTGLFHFAFRAESLIAPLSWEIGYVANSTIAAIAYYHYIARCGAAARVCIVASDAGSSQSADAVAAKLKELLPDTAPSVVKVACRLVCTVPRYGTMFLLAGDEGFTDDALLARFSGPWAATSARDLIRQMNHVLYQPLDLPGEMMFVARPAPP